MNDNLNHTVTIIKKQKWWNRRSRLERAFIALTTILTSIILALLIAIIYINKTVSSKTCTTWTCLAEASRITWSLNENVSPCDDFYEFACGNFAKAGFPSKRAWIDQFEIVQDQITEQLDDMLDATNEKAIKPFQIVKAYYDACKNTDAIQMEGLNSIKHIIKSQLGGWPVLNDNWNEEEFDWKQLIYKFRRFGFDFDGIIKMEVDVDPNDSTKYTVFLDQAALSLSRKFLIKGRDDSLIKAYYDYMVDVAEIFGADRQKALNELDTSLEFELKLANISLAEEDLRDLHTLNNVFTIKELQRNFTTIPWLYYINNIIDDKTSFLKLHDTVLVRVPKYFKQLEDLIRATPKRALSNYLIWHVIQPLVPNLNNEVLNRNLKFINALTGELTRKPRWEECMFAPKALNLAVAALLVRNYFSDETRQHAKEVMTDLRSEFKDRLENVDWMDDTTRKNALEKVDSLTEHIGYPDEFLDDQKLIEYYKDLRINTSNYFSASLNLSLFSYKIEFEKLQRRVNKTDWREHGNIMIVNAYYRPAENSVFIPISMLQDPIFKPNRPRYLNFGAIGFIIGYEIIRGFDDQGRLYDKQGNFIDWWTANSTETFNKKAQCFIDQYSKYRIPEINVTLNGVNTQRRNIADNGGAKMAYFAYQKWVAKFGIEKMLPGLNYTPNQLFWISSANLWCSKWRRNRIRYLVEADHHSFAKFRVNGPLQNYEEFAKDFNCALGSQMNPIRKCSVW